MQRISCVPSRPADFWIFVPRLRDWLCGRILSLYNMIWLVEEKKIMYISSRNVKLGLPFVCRWRVLSSFFFFFCWRVDHEVWCCDTLTLTMMSILAGARNVNGRRWPGSANRNHWAGGGCVATCGTLKHLLVVLRTWLLYPVGRSCCRVLITGVVELINQECAIMHASVSKDHLQRLSRRRNEGIDERN